MKKITSIFGKSLLLASAFCFTLPLDAAKKSKSKGSGVVASIPAEGRKVFVFTPRSLSWALYGSNGKLIRSGHAVGGKSYCPDVRRGCRTPVGTFRVYHKEGPNFVSSRYPLPNGGAHMPWAVFFHKGYAIHGSNDVPGRHASHGCIRVYPSDARWINGALPFGSKVVVRSY